MVLAVWMCTAAFSQPANEKGTVLLVSRGLPRAVIVADPLADAVIRTAVNTFVEGVRHDGGTAPAITDALPKAGPVVLIGTSATNAVLAGVAEQAALGLDKLAPEGFLVRTLTVEGHPCLLIAGKDARGVLYGVQEALAQVVTCTPTGGVFARMCDIRRQPALSARGTYCLTCWNSAPRYDRAAWEAAIDSMSEAGMNRVMFWMDGLFRSQTHPEAFLNKPGQHYEGVRLTTDDIQRLIGFAHDRGMEFFFGSGVFAWFAAGEGFAKRYPEAVDHTGRNLCPSNPTAQRVTLDYLAEMIEVFPKADGYMLEIRDELGDCKCPTCQKPLDERGSKQFGQSELDFLARLTETVWKKHPKTKLIWLIGYANHKDDPKYYERIREMGRDPRMEWLEVRMSWKLPAADGTEKPLTYFSDRIYHWDAYYQMAPEHMQARVKQTVAEGLHGYLPAYEPGFSTRSIYGTKMIPFPVRLIPFCLTQFLYREFTWDPQIDQKTLLERLHREHFSAEVPLEMADDLLFFRRFNQAHYIELTHSIGEELQPNASLPAIIDDIWTTPRKADKEWLLTATAATIRSFKTLADGKGDMARLGQIEERIERYRPGASRRSAAGLDLMQKAIDDIRAAMARCVDYKADADKALKLIDEHLEELRAAKKQKGPGTHPD